MTRINLIPVAELSDQHLMAEYRELPRIVNGVLEGKLHPTKIPTKYVLGTGHVKFFTNKILFLAKRYKLIHQELIYRNFNLDPNYTPKDMLRKIKSGNYRGDEKYVFSEKDITLSRQRIIEKILMKPDWYKWTNRKKPKY